MGDTVSDLLMFLDDSAEPLAYRLAAFFTMSVLDDPAILAMAFC